MALAAFGRARHFGVKMILPCASEHEFSSGGHFDSFGNCFTRHSDLWAYNKILVNLFFSDNCRNSLRKTFGRHFERKLCGYDIQKFVEFLERHVAVRFFPATEPHLDADFVAPPEKFGNFHCIALEIVPSGRESDADTFNLNVLLLFSMFALALFLLVSEFSELHNLANGRLGSWRDFDQIKIPFLCKA